MNFISIDGKIVNDSEPVLMHNNRSFRYGDGLFETMKMINGQIPLKEFHFERLYKSLSLLNYRIPSSFTQPLIEKLIEELAEKNGCRELCRIRLSVYRGNGNLSPTPDSLGYLIECSTLAKIVNSFNEEGFKVGTFRDAQKSCDSFSNIKSANFLPYVLGAIHAGQSGLDDCVLLNSRGNIADTTIANIFLVHEQNISTPALTEGCINGVMRRYLVEKFYTYGYSCREKEITEEDIKSADELFLTNSINGIRWIKEYADIHYSNTFIRRIYKEFIEPIFA